MIDARLLADIKTAESCSLEPYLDTKGYWTIGWGHFIGHGPKPSLLWTQERADGQLDMDIALAQGTAEQLSEWAALDTPCRQNALIELCFNMGSRWLGFTFTRASIRAKNWQGAHDGLLNSLWAVEVGVLRSTRLANYLLKGAYP